MSATKRPRLDIIVAVELEAIDHFLEVLPTHLSQGSSERRESESWLESEGALIQTWGLDRAESLARESVILMLNNTIDWALLALVNRATERAAPDRLQIQRKSRKQLLGIIERHYGVRVRFLSGWAFTERVREAANAVKHRGGVTLVEHDRIPIPEVVSVDVSLGTCRQCAAGVRAWLSALLEATEGSSDGA